MSVFSGISPIKQALVHYLRADEQLRAAVGSGGFHEGPAPSKTNYPFVTYQVHYAPMRYDWTSVIHEVGFDVFAWSENSVEADNLDQLLFTILHDADIEVTGQSTLICRRVSSLSLPGFDDEGKKIYQAGGIYELWTDQPLPQARTGSFTADADIA